MSISEKALQLKEDFDEVYEAGKQKEWSDFWDIFQQKGNRKRYEYAFSQGYYNQGVLGWTDKTFKPKYDMKPTNAERMFEFTDNITDLKGILEKQGVTLDLSNCTSSAFMFRACAKLTRLPVLDFSQHTGTASISSCFKYCYALESIDKIIFNNEGTNITEVSTTFDSCGKLKEIRFEGVIGRSISFAWSPLSLESMKSIITHLKDYSGTTNAGKYTLTLKDSCKTLMAEQGTMEELGGKTYDQYITDIGWNLA